MARARAALTARAKTRSGALAIALRVEGRGGAAMNERLAKIRRADGEAQLEKLSRGKPALAR